MLYERSINLQSRNDHFLGADRRNLIRRYGYSMCGRPLTNHQLLWRGSRLSALVVMSVNGLLDVRIVHGVTNGKVFYCFIEECLLPHLMVLTHIVLW